MATSQDTSAPAQLIPYPLKQEFDRVTKTLWYIEAQCKMMARVFSEETEIGESGINGPELETIFNAMAETAISTWNEFELAARPFKFAPNPKEEMEDASNV